MSKINAVRFINLNYNRGAIRVSDETMHFNGDSTLIKLDNGGGKTVLVQMMTAPFVQKRYRNMKDRPFSSYFTSSRPTFILVEWLLDQNAGFVMTGMMVRKNQSPADGNEDELEIINILSEYREPCLQDIHHIPVVEKTKDDITLKNFAACRQLFDSYKKDRSLRFFSYDMNNSAQSRQYFDKLMEYGIDYREWQNIIKKVNEEESGLSKLFSDSKDERGLVEKWFLYTIENKLNRDQNRMQEFRNILEKYVASYHRNQSKIRQRDTILHFEQEAEKIREQAEVYQSSSQRWVEKRNEIAVYIQKLLSLQTAVQQELANEEAYIEELKTSILKTDHERLSAEYYGAQDQLTVIDEKISVLTDLLSETESKRKQWEYTLHLLQLAEKQEQVDSARSDYQDAVQALDVCRKKGEDLKPERDYIGYLLHQYYDEVIVAIETELTKTDTSITELSETRHHTEIQITKTEQSIREAAQEKGSLKASVQAYDHEEHRFFVRWKVDLNRNLMGEYDAGFLQILSDRLENELTEATKERTAKRKQLEQTKFSIRKQEQNLSRKEEARQKVSQLLKSAETALSHYEEQLQYRRTVLQYLELREDVLFDKERILRAADSKISELEILIEKTSIEVEQIKEEIHNLTTGRTIPISPELQRMLEGLGIHTVYGMEWLKKNGKSEQENLALVDCSPFLPYALIMSEKEFQRLSDAELPVFTGAPIPIVTRESLSEDSSERAASADTPAGVHFYMMFNRNLLNEERLAELLDRKNRDLDFKKEELERKRKEFREYIERRNKISEQVVTKDTYEETKESISEAKEQLQKIKTSYAEISGHLADLRKTEEDLGTEINALTKKIDELSQKKEDLLLLSQAYERYLSQRKELVQCEKKLSRLDSDKNRMQIRLKQIEEQIQLFRNKRAELSVDEKEKRAEASIYQIYHEVLAPDGFQSELADDYTALIARYSAITDSVSREVKELEAAQKKAADSLAKAEKALAHLAGKHDIPAEEWRAIRYSMAELDHVEETIDNLGKELTENTDTKHRLEINQAKVTKSIDHILESMQKECGIQIPVPREEIHSIDYAGQKNILINEKKQHEKEAKQLQDRIVVLRTNLTTLAEFQDIVVVSAVRFKQDFSRFSEEDFRTFTGSLQRDDRVLEKDVSEQRNRLEKVIQQIMRMDDFKDDYYKKPLETFSALTADSDQVLKQLEVVLQSYHDLLEKLKVDIAFIEKERIHVIAALKEYTLELHSQMGKIDRNSSILVRGKPLKMLKITLPSWEEYDNIYQRRLEDFVDDITNKGIALLEKGETTHDLVGKRLTTRELYDSVVGISNVRIQLYKIEAQRELPISWSEVAKNSGGEGFLSAFIVLSSLLYYMRRDETDIFADRNEGKVLLMDNPFAQTNASHLLKPMMETAKKNNTQLICLTGLGGESIYNRFDNIYVLNLVEAALSNNLYLRGKHITGKEPEIVSFSRFEVTDYEQEEMLF